MEIQWNFTIVELDAKECRAQHLCSFSQSSRSHLQVKVKQNGFHNYNLCLRHFFLTIDGNSMKLHKTLWRTKFMLLFQRSRSHLKFTKLYNIESLAQEPQNFLTCRSERIYGPLFLMKYLGQSLYLKWPFYIMNQLSIFVIISYFSNIMQWLSLQ